LELRRWDESRALLEQFLAEDPNEPAMLMHLALVADYQGDRDETLRLSRLLEARASPSINHYLHAWIAAGRGERERAMALLGEAMASGMLYSIGLHRNIYLESLWDYPPFQELLGPKG
jgi:hypothetical protein